MADLIFKWLKSENCSSIASKQLAAKTREAFGMTHKEYRKLLSWGREKEKVLEKMMSANEWDKIDFSKIPSKAGLIYKNAFSRRDILAKKYESFIKDKNTKVNADTLYPYEIVGRATKEGQNPLDDINRLATNKYWENQKDYLNGTNCKMMCVCDTSVSMTWGTNPRPIDVAIGLSMYCAERIGGPFKDHFISFSRNPQLIKVEGVDFVDKAYRIYRSNRCENTDLVKTFRLLKDLSLQARPEDRLDTVVVLSDMEIDAGSCGTTRFTKDNAATEMERMRSEWEAVGLEMPKLVYWNINARQNRILDSGTNVSFVSGASASIFESILTNKSGYDLMISKLVDSGRYDAIK